MANSDGFERYLMDLIVTYYDIGPNIAIRTHRHQNELGRRREPPGGANPSRS